MSPRSHSVFAVLAAGLLASGCRDVAGPAPILTDHRVLYSVLEVGSPSVRVVAEEYFAEGFWQPLLGMTGSVSGSQGAAALRPATPDVERCFVPEAPGTIQSDELACYLGALPQPAGASEQLTLDVVMPDGARVSGVVVTPEPPMASIPADSQRVSVAFQQLPELDRLPIAIVPIVLEAAPGGHRVDVVATVERLFVFGGSGATVDPTGCRVETSTAPFREGRLQGAHDLYLYKASCGVTWDSLDLAVHVVSMEANYAGYMDRVLGSSSVDRTRARFGLDGAVGVFGAVATTILPLRVIFDP